MNYRNNNREAQQTTIGRRVCVSDKLELRKQNIGALCHNNNRWNMPPLSKDWWQHIASSGIHSESAALELQFCLYRTHYKPYVSWMWYGWDVKTGAPLYLASMLSQVKDPSHGGNVMPSVDEKLLACVILSFYFLHQTWNKKFSYVILSLNV